MKTLFIILTSVLLYSCSQNDNLSETSNAWTGNYAFVSSTSSDPTYATSGCTISVSNESSFSIANSCLNPYVQDVLIIPISGNTGTIYGYQIADHWTLNSGTIVRSGNTLTATYSITVRNLDGTIHGNPQFTNTYRK